MARSLLRTRAAVLAVLVCALVGLTAMSGGLLAPAYAGGNVTVDNGGNGAVIDATYSSTLTVSGRGFQSIRGGHGGIYVWFGTVSGNWRPSKGGTSGVNYRYVPDKETKGNKGFQRYVAFPGSDTAASANGGTMSADGSWRVNLLVPGPTFQAVGRNGTVETVDCRTVTCGVITVGAHGVKNANNESFTPVRVSDLQHGESTTPQGSTQTAPATQTSGQTGQVTGGVKVAKKASLDVDRASALPGRALSFLARGLTPQSQVTVVLDDGVVASGPHLVGADGVVAGVIQLPVELSAGTHELRVFGAGKSPSVKFGVTVQPQTVAAPTDDTSARPATAALVFALLAMVAFLVALVAAVLRFVRSRRAQA